MNTEKYILNVNIFGNVQAGNLQIVQGASFQQNVEPNEKNKEIFKRILYWIYNLILFLAALLTCLHLLGWLELIKAFIYKILLHK